MEWVGIRNQRFYLLDSSQAGIGYCSANILSDVIPVSVILPVVNGAFASGDRRCFASESIGFHSAGTETRQMQTLGKAAGVAPRKAVSTIKRQQARTMLLVRMGLLLTSVYLFGYYAFHNSLDKSLVSAIEHGDVDGAKFALKWGADPNARDAQQHPALMLALTFTSEASDIDSRRTQMAGMLLEHGADPKIRDRNGGSSLIRYAISNGYVGVARLLLARGAEIRGEEGAASLRAAATRGFNEATILLLDSGVHVDAVRDDSSGETPLMVAALRHNVQVVETLLTRGADVNRRNDYGISALMFAVMDFPTIADTLTLLTPPNSDAKQIITRLLLQHGADFRQTDRYKNTALDYALAKENKGTVLYMRGNESPAPTRKIKELVTLLQAANSSLKPH